jgi:protease secretion system outer membrane protein
MAIFCALKRLLPRVVVPALTVLAGLAHAGPLTDAFDLARKHDPAFQAAKSERDAGVASSQVASTAYLPQFQGTLSQLETETATRQTYSISQPLINADKFATFREAGPREALAVATFQVREQELSQRLLKAVAELLKNSENLRLNISKIDALGKQSESAAKGFELGQGTVTDVRDAQVRLEQARADSLMLESRISAGKRQLTSITGADPTSLLFSVPRQARLVDLRPLGEYLDLGRKLNPQILIAQQNQRIADLAMARADGTLVPTVSAVYTSTSSNGVSNQYTGVNVNLPLQVGSFFQMRGANANANRAREQTRDTEQKTELEVERLWSLVNAGKSELAIRLSAISSAELSVEANEKSFKGGVRSQIDVLNSIQILFQVQQEYVNALLGLSENYLNLLLLAAVPAEQAVARVQASLLPQ